MTPVTRSAAKRKPAAARDVSASAKGKGKGKAPQGSDGDSDEEPPELDSSSGDESDGSADYGC